MREGGSANTEGGNSFFFLPRNWDFPRLHVAVCCKATRYLHLSPENVRELKRDPISQAIECGDCHLSNGWRRAFYRRTVKCANKRPVPPLHFNQIISPFSRIGCPLALKDLAGLKGLIFLPRSHRSWSACFFSPASVCFNVPRPGFNILFRASIVTRKRNEP